MILMKQILLLEKQPLGFCKATTERDGFPQLDKVGLGFTAELHGKVWSVPLVLRLVFIRITWATC